MTASAPGAARGTALGLTLPVTLTPRAARQRAAGAERHVTMLAIALAAGFVVLAIVSLLAPPAMRQGTWVPLHLLLAGAASTAIAGVMPFFSAAVTGAPPAAPPIRLTGVGGVAIGAAVVVAGRTLSPGLDAPGSVVAASGGLIYMVGLAAVAAATLLPLRSALDPRRLVMGGIYGVALLNVLVGASMSTLFLLGWTAAVDAWESLKPAHAWLNLFGFISLVIAGSLLHLLPTVAGARIQRTRASVACFGSLASGPVLVAAGFVLGSAGLAVIGAAVVVLGGAALGWHAVTVLRHRASWTTDPHWHRFTTWSLVAGIGWFISAAVIAAATIVAGGATAAGWDLTPLVAPIGVGWVGQVLVGAWSHLVPAIGPGSPEWHARQRQRLGQAGGLRLLLLNGGVAALALAQALTLPMLAAFGLGAVVLAGLTAVLLVAAALRGRPRDLPAAAV